MAKKIELYDTTLRDGSQAEEVSFSLDDKLKITETLDDLGIQYLEGGWPGSNPKDAAYFDAVKKLTLKQIKIAAFGSTHHQKNKPANDNNVKLLLEADTPVVTIVGKSSEMQAKKVLGVSAARNLALIHDTMRYLSSRVEETIFDAEHFFDGYKANREYTLKTIEAAIDAGTSLICLCDSNGGALPTEVEEAIKETIAAFPGVRFGIHCHNDSELGVANTLAGVKAGVNHVQGTINGIGERCGNANLCSIIPNLQLKMGYRCVTATQMKKLRTVSGMVSDLANMAPRPHQAYVGRSAFAHKGGIHVAAIRKTTAAYEHIDPEIVGNRRRVLISDLSGRGNILAKAEEFGLDLGKKDDATKNILAKLKDLENKGFVFEGADASFELLMRKALGQWKKKFEVVRARVVSNFSDSAGQDWAEAVIKLKMPNGDTAHAVAEGNGPVNALDKAIRQALIGYYPQLADVELHDFKVRLLDEKSKTAAVTRVLIESGDGVSRWSSVGVSANVIEAAWMALLDSLEYKLHKPNVRKTKPTKKQKSSAKKKRA